jgi:demethoxyubiquinone hydroxylase (CLK1/Coq7/Cat5 family)
LKGELARILPDNRTRPSLLSPLAGLASLGFGIGAAILGPEKSMSLLTSMETALQEEQDEMLRILNEHQVDNKEVRQSIVNQRDCMYDHLKKDSPFQAASPEDSLNSAVKFLTHSMIKLS